MKKLLALTLALVLALTLAAASAETVKAKPAPFETVFKASGPPDAPAGS